MPNVPPGAIPGPGGGGNNLGGNLNIPGQRVFPTGANAKFVDDVEAEHGPAIWTDYMIFNRYEFDKHIYMNGVTQPTPFRGQSVAFVQLASPTLLLVSDWTAARLGKQPIVPDPTPPDDWVLMDVFPEAAPVNVAPDGSTPLFRITGTYVYGCKKPGADVFKLVTIPRIPWLTDTFERRVLSTSLGVGIIFSNVNILRSPGLGR